MDQIDRHTKVFSEYAEKNIEVFAFDQRVRLRSLQQPTCGSILQSRPIAFDSQIAIKRGLA